MEHGRASIEIWFMMTQWELDRTSARAMLQWKINYDDHSSRSTIFISLYV